MILQALPGISGVVVKLGSRQSRKRRKGNPKKVSEAKQREFISHAVSMYRDRGTRQGLEDLIFLYTGKKPIIIENLPAGCIKRRSEYENRKENKRRENQKGDNSKNESPKKNRNPEQKSFSFSLRKKQE
ncbi:MAG: hypothetical protein NHB15_10870 [Methanosarcina barkeri]|nr:hypothetical protein [Methanosarcina sp. ERenArc_MAG2]